jgi:isoamylase
MSPVRSVTYVSGRSHEWKLGVTAVELMPVHAFLTDKHLAEKNLTNYRGYNTTNFFSPDARY